MGDKMGTTDLLNSLKQQEKNLREFLEAILRKQKAIVNSDLEALETALHEEEKLLGSIQSVENKRINLLKDLNEVYSPENKSVKLSDFLNSGGQYLEENFSLNARKVQDNIRNLIEYINRVNFQNKVLIDNAREIIKLTFAEIVASQKKSLLDKRV